VTSDSGGSQEIDAASPRRIGRDAIHGQAAARRVKLRRPPEPNAQTAGPRMISGLLERLLACLARTLWIAGSPSLIEVDVGFWSPQAPFSAAFFIE